ncbi:MAG TPA: sigma-70 family RNA polymerase sigma factor, partial [Vicinamibacteria bacterium]
AAAAPEAELDAAQRLDNLRAAFDELPAQDHRVLVMRELEGRSYREIAERTKLTLAAVESSLFRGRRRLELEYEELAAGRRCAAARASAALIAEGVESRSARRRLARHARRCGYCRRHARQLGVEPFAARRLQRRAAGLLPLGWLLPRSTQRPPAPDRALAIGAGGQLGAGLVERVAAVVAAGALALAGSASVGTAEQAAPPQRPASAAAAPGPAATAGGAPARPRARHAPNRPGSRLRHRAAAPAKRSSPAAPVVAPQPAQAQAPAPTPTPAVPTPPPAPTEIELSGAAPVPAVPPAPTELPVAGGTSVGAPAPPAVEALPQTPPLPGNVGTALPG